ncbi:AMP-binding protein [Myxococcota bacterium]|nr:AMP-binding protein [Myxococcota bacterium]
MLGAFKARVVPFNVNYRYVEDELLYVLTNASAKAIIYHSTFAPALDSIRKKLPHLRLLLQVADESDNELLSGALDFEAALKEATPREPENLSPDDLYMLYTGGTTGKPKGVMWRQEDIIAAALLPRNCEPNLNAIVQRALKGGVRSLPAPPFMHGAAHWIAFNMWHIGGTVFVQSNTKKLDPEDIWETIEREGITALSIVGNAFATPLIDVFKNRAYNATTLRLITTGGAILSSSAKAAFHEILPDVKILDTLGSSESGTQASQMSEAGKGAETAKFAILTDSAILNDSLNDEVKTESGEEGWLARRGNVPLGYLDDPEKTAQPFPVINGTRYSIPGDRAVAKVGGEILLLGRASGTINTGGEKVFAEEVEEALKESSEVYDAVVIGMPNERFGQQITAIVRLREGVVSGEEIKNRLSSFVRTVLASYKAPKDYIFVEEVVRSPSGKADYGWAKQIATDASGTND